MAGDDTVLTIVKCQLQLIQNTSVVAQNDARITMQ